MKNWKTTLFGLMLAAGQALQNSPKPTIAIVGQILSVIGAAGVGAAARDKSVGPPKALYSSKPRA